MSKELTDMFPQEIALGLCMRVMTPGATRSVFVARIDVFPQNIQSELGMTVIMRGGTRALLGMLLDESKACRPDTLAVARGEVRTRIVIFLLVKLNESKLTTIPHTPAIARGGVKLPHVLPTPVKLLQESQATTPNAPTIAPSGVKTLLTHLHLIKLLILHRRRRRNVTKPNHLPFPKTPHPPWHRQGSPEPSTPSSPSRPMPRRPKSSMRREDGVSRFIQIG